MAGFALPVAQTAAAVGVVVSFAGIEIHFRNFLALGADKKLFSHFSEARTAILAIEKIE
jgi:hypothetical protein